MSGGGGSSKSTTLNYSPEETARRTQVMDEALRIYGDQKNNISEYPGAMPVGFSADSVRAQELMRQAATNNIGLLGDLSGAVKYGLKGAMDIQNNPYFSNALSAAVRPVTRNFREQVLPGISSAAIKQGAYGGGRQGVAEALASDRYLQNVSDISSSMALDAYNKGQDTFARTLAFTPEAMRASQIPAEQLSSVGTQNEAFAQQWENYLANAREWEINAPWMPLQNAANIVYGGGGSQSTTKTSAPPRNQLTGAVGGGMAGWALGSSGMGAALGLTGPWGAAAGALLGALM